MGVGWVRVLGYGTTGVCFIKTVLNTVSIIQTD